MEDYIEEEHQLTRKLFNLEEIIQFTKEHRVEVLLGADYQYMCYIDYKTGDGGWGTSLTPLGALVIGIKQYKENKN